MKFSILKMAMIFAISVFVFTSCDDDDDPVITNPEEIITTLNYTLTPNTGNPVVFSFRDLDGDGGNAPVITNGTLAANTTYAGSIELLNESEDPAEDIGEEVAEEDEEHQFFFTVGNGLNATVAYTDQDADGNPIGLTSTVTTGDASQGQLTIILRHEPDKNASGVSSGDITNAGGETDIEVTFTVDIQ